jgi:NodT family efflux transporter outer membrane factor (OMF) lipoprotein
MAHSRFSIFTLSLMLSACAMGPDYKKPTTAMTPSFKEAGAWKPATPKDDVIRAKWWEAFGDPDLNALEEQVNINNQTIKADEAAFRSARALVAEARAQYFPTLSASGSMSRSGSGSSRTINTTGATSSSSSTITPVTTSGNNSRYVTNDYSASLDASWEPDLWGRIRRTVESNKASAQASAADLASAKLSLQTMLAEDYLDLRLSDEQKRVLDRTVKAYQRSLLLTQNQYKVGVAAQSDVLQAKVQLETTQAQDINVGVLRAQYEHAIAMLIGKAPAEFSIAVTQNVPKLPTIPLTIPSKLLERRPDIAASERLADAANAQIGIAKAAYFPDLTLSASGGYQSTQLARLFSLPSRVWSIGPTLAEPLFDAGLRSAQTEAAVANYDEAVANYRQTVLSAFQQVEDALSGLRILDQELQAQSQTVEDAKKSVTITINEYKAGTIAYTSVVTAQAAELSNELSAITTRQSQLNDAASLITALGGGWNASELKKPEVTQGETTPLSILPAQGSR